jgi:choline dehydrogenase-like flavoprotein
VVSRDPSFDAVIVGAGAAGSLIAAKLAAAGKRTLVLDAGPAWTTADLISSPIWSRRLKWDS